jgi:hypothetical protein
MKEKIWREFCQAKFNLELTNVYEQKARRYNSVTTITIVIISALGMGAGFKKELYSVISCGLTFLVSLLKALQPHVIVSQEKFENMNTLNSFYFSHSIKLEKLYQDLYDNSIDEEKAKNQFFKLKESEKKIVSISNKTIINPSKKLIQKAISNTDKYFKEKYNTEKK